jgi:hypothetical protein
MPPPPAGQAQAWAPEPEEDADYLRAPAAAEAQAAIGSSAGEAARSEAAGGVRGGGGPHRDLGARALRLRMDDLDRLAAGRAWGDILGEAARSGQIVDAVARIRRRLAAVAPDARADYARIVRRQITLLEREGLAVEAVALRRLLDQIEDAEAGAKAARKLDTRSARAKNKAAQEKKARGMDPAASPPAAEPADAAKAVGF